MDHNDRTPRRQAPPSGAPRCPVCQSPAGPPDQACGACCASLASPWGMCPSQLRGAAPTEPTEAALIDRWGGVWRLPRRTVIGRDPARCQLALLHGDVSPVHALLELGAAGWWLSDLGSRTGTWLERRRVTAAALPRVARVRVGAMELFFLADARALRAPDAAARREADEITAPFAVDEQPVAAPSALVLVEASSGWGRLSRGDRGVPVPPCQLTLLQALAQRWHDDHAVAPADRGFVAIDAVLAVIPWEATAATRTNLKQLVRRTRLTLAALDVDDHLEGRRSAGGAYRMRGGVRLER